MAPTIEAVSIRLPGLSAARKPSVTPTRMAKVMAANTSFSDGQTRTPISLVTGSRVRNEVPRSPMAVWATYLAKRSARGSSRPISLRMRSITAGSMVVRPSSPMPEMKLPGRTLNSRKTSATTASRVGMTLARRRARTKQRIIDPSADDRPLGRRYFAGEVGIDPDVLGVLMRDLGRVGLQAVDPRLIGQHRLVVVEEPNRRFVVEQVVGLAQQVVALGHVAFLGGVVEQLVELRIVEAGVVAGGARRLGVVAAQGGERVGAGQAGADIGLVVALHGDLGQHRDLDQLGLHLDAHLGEHRDDRLDDRQAPALVLAGRPLELEAVGIARLGQQLLGLARDRRDRA